MEKTFDPKKLIEQAKNGDPESFGLLYEHFFTPVYRYIYLRLGEKQTAEDLTQTVFVKVYQHLSQLRITHTEPLAYFFTVARNTIIDFTRKKKPERLEDFPILAETLAEHRPTPDEQTNTKLNITKLKSAIETLTTDQQEVIVLKFISELTNTEIANLLDKTEENIRQLQFRALKNLRNTLADL